MGVTAARLPSRRAASSRCAALEDEGFARRLAAGGLRDRALRPRARDARRRARTGAPGAAWRATSSSGAGSRRAATTALPTTSSDCWRPRATRTVSVGHPRPRLRGHDRRRCSRRDGRRRRRAWSTSCSWSTADSADGDRGRSRAARAPPWSRRTTCCPSTARRWARATRCGARVARDRAATSSAFLDADTADPDPRHLLGLLGPLLEDEHVALVKGELRAAVPRPRARAARRGRPGDRADGAAAAQPPRARSSPASASRWPVRPQRGARCCGASPSRSAMASRWRC